MVVLGLIFVLLAVAAGVLAVYGLPSADAPKITWDLLGSSFSLSATTIFFVGVASAVALGLGLWLMGAGAARNARKRRELRDLRREQKEKGRFREDYSRTAGGSDAPAATSTTRPTVAERDGLSAPDDRADGSTSWTDSTR